MSELSSRLNLIQRAMQRGGQPRAPVVVDDGKPKIAPAQPQHSILDRAETAAAPVEPRVEIESAAPNKSAQSVHLNSANLRASRIATPDNKNSATYNEFRAVKRKLLSLIEAPESSATPRNVVMVTSALPREGKTFTVLNLAFCLAAEHNLDVILVDGDVIRGSISTYFDSQNQDGLVELLTGKRQKIEEVLHSCAELPSLHVLFAGKRDEAATELLSSPRMSEICHSLSKRYRRNIVLFDTPPVLATSESASLAAHADHLIMLVASGQAARDQVETALAEVSSCPSINLLFNRSAEWARPMSGPSYYYGYGLDESQVD